MVALLVTTVTFYSITVIDCGPPSMVTPGGVVVSTTTFGSIATYQCDQGYVLNPSDEASRMRTCQDDGSWFGPDPACESMLSDS